MDKTICKEKSESNNNYNKISQIIIIFSITRIVFVFIMGIQFYLSFIYQNYLAQYEDDLNSASLMRNNLIFIWDTNLEFSTKLISTDSQIAYENATGIITEEEANETISRLQADMFSNNLLMINMLFIWNSSYPNIAPISGGFVVNPEFRWLFTEGVIDVFWLPRWYNKSALIEARYSYWHNTKYSLNVFLYDYTAELLSTNFRWAFPPRDLPQFSLQGRIDWAPIWLVVDISINDFDTYVERTILNPKLNTEKFFSNIQRSMMGTTIGILLLGFLINFDKLERTGFKLFFKAFYYFLVLMGIGYSIGALFR